MTSIPVWLPVTISLVGTAIALTAFGYQVWRARFNQSIDLLFKLDGDFFGPAKKLQRAKAAIDLQNGRYSEVEPILDFFETMALLVRRGALDKEMVWHTFYYWAEHYYAAAYPHIEARQKQDPLVWKDLVPFMAALHTFQQRQLVTPSLRALTPEEIAAFLSEEKSEAIV